MPTLSFEEFCRARYPFIARAAYLVTGDRQEALDVTQEAFVRAYERWDNVMVMENPDGWLYRVAINLATSSRRRAVRRWRSTRSSDVPEPEAADPRLGSALQALTPAQRNAVVCRYFLDLSIEETARVLDKRPGTIRALTSQATSRLRASLGREFMEVNE